MNHATKANTAAQEAEPTSALTPVPLWLMVLAIGLFYVSAVGFDSDGGWFEAKVYAPYHSVADVQRFQPKTGGPDEVIQRGKLLFNQNCALCHGADGLGKPNQAPPLAGSEWVLTKGVNRLIHIPLVGLAGPIQVKGQEWNLNMAAMGAAYSHEDLAAVLSYIRNDWGNKASLVTPDQVKAVKADIGNRSQPTSADELKKMEE